MSQTQRKAACECGNDTFYFVKDLNLDKVWKAGNKYARICTGCGSRFFLSKAMWEAADDTYVILKGDDAPIPLFDCPVCSEAVTGTPDACPYCDAEFDWSHYEEPGAVETAEEAAIEDEQPAPAAEAEAEVEAGFESEAAPDEGQRPEPSAEITVTDAQADAAAAPDDDEGDDEGDGDEVPKPLRVHQHPDELREMHYNEMKTLAADSDIPAVGTKAELLAEIASIRLRGLDEDHDHYDAWVAASDPENN